MQVEQHDDTSISQDSKDTANVIDLDKDDMQVDANDMYDFPYSFKSGLFYKIFDRMLTLLNLKADKSILHEYRNVFFSKFIQISRTEGIIIGGASDSQKEHALKTCYKMSVSDGKVIHTAVASMLYSRIGCAVCISQNKNFIYVVGGVTDNNQLLKSCEVYNVQANKWNLLPDFPCLTTSSSICEYVHDKNKWLYVFGGISDFGGNDKRTTTDTVCRLRIDTESPDNWELLSVKLPFKACDSGSLQLSNDKIIVLGGWNQDKLSQCTIFKINQGKCDIDDTKKVELKTGDFFVGGEAVFYNEGHVIISGMKGLHDLNLKNYTFEHKEI